MNPSSSSSSNPIEQLRQVLPRLPEIAVAILQAIHEAHESQNASKPCTTTSSSSSDSSSSETSSPTPTPQVRHFAICDNCRRPIIGIRYKCVNCADFDLCSQCENTNTDGQTHDATHVFLKLTRPMSNPLRRSQPLIQQILVVVDNDNNQKSNTNVNGTMRCRTGRGPFHCSRVRPIINTTSNTSNVGNVGNATNLTDSESSRVEQLSNQLEQLRMQVQALKEQHEHQQHQRQSSCARPYGHLYRPHFVHPLFCPTPSSPTTTTTDIEHDQQAVLHHDDGDGNDNTTTNNNTSTVVSTQVDTEQVDDNTANNTNTSDDSDYISSINGAAVPLPVQQDNEQQSNEYEQQVQSLIAMGVNDEQARIALSTTNGNIEEAIELLFE